MSETELNWNCKIIVPLNFTDDVNHRESRKREMNLPRLVPQDHFFLLSNEVGWASALCRFSYFQCRYVFSAMQYAIMEKNTSATQTTRKIDGRLLQHAHVAHYHEEDFDFYKLILIYIFHSVNNYQELKE
jgi:hypothetical protein